MVRWTNQAFPRGFLVAGTFHAVAMCVSIYFSGESSLIRQIPQSFKASKPTLSSSHFFSYELLFQIKMQLLKKSKNNKKDRLTEKRCHHTWVCVWPVKNCGCLLQPRFHSSSIWDLGQLHAFIHHKEDSACKWGSSDYLHLRETWTVQIRLQPFSCPFWCFLG